MLVARGFNRPDARPVLPVPRQGNRDFGPSSPPRVAVGRPGPELARRHKVALSPQQQIKGEVSKAQVVAVVQDGLLR